MASVSFEARSSWPPKRWEVRRVVAEPVRVFHVNDQGFMMEPVQVGDVLLVEPAGPYGHRATGFTTAFTRRASQLSGFDNCCVAVLEVLEGTAMIGAYDASVVFGSGGRFPFPIEASSPK